MNEFFRQLADALEAGPVALATVIAARGSTPRTVGARQFLAADGRIAGTVGGGAMEARTLAHLRATLADGVARTFEADLHGRPGDVRDGICGGAMTLAMVRIEPTDHGTVRALADQLAEGRQVAVPFAPGGGIVIPSPLLVVVGAGHIGRALAALMVRVGFVVRVQDERSDWRDPAAFPADCRLDGSPTACRQALETWEGERFVALVSRGYGEDVAALRALATTPGLRYLGVLGSRPRIATVLAACREEGLALPEEVLHAPLGVEIGAETPEEIAVSIAAEIIRVHRRGA